MECVHCNCEINGEPNTVRVLTHTSIGDCVYHQLETVPFVCASCQFAMQQLGIAVKSNKSAIVKVDVDDDCTGIVGPFNSEKAAEDWVDTQLARIDIEKAPAQRPVNFTITKLLEPY